MPLETVALPDVVRLPMVSMALPTSKVPEPETVRAAALPNAFATPSRSVPPETETEFVATAPFSVAVPPSIFVSEPVPEIAVIEMALAPWSVTPKPPLSSVPESVRLPAAAFTTVDVVPVRAFWTVWAKEELFTTPAPPSESADPATTYDPLAEPVNVIPVTLESWLSLVAVPPAPEKVTESPAPDGALPPAQLEPVLQLPVPAM